MGRPAATRVHAREFPASVFTAIVTSKHDSKLLDIGESVIHPASTAAEVNNVTVYELLD